MLFVIEVCIITVICKKEIDWEICDFGYLSLRYLWSCISYLSLRYLSLRYFLYHFFSLRYWWSCICYLSLRYFLLIFFYLSLTNNICHRDICGIASVIRHWDIFYWFFSISVYKIIFVIDIFLELHQLFVIEIFSIEFFISVICHWDILYLFSLSLRYFLSRLFIFLLRYFLSQLFVIAIFFI